MHYTTSQNKTNVRFSIMDSALRAFPVVGERVLSQLFLTPQRRVPRRKGEGAVVDRISIDGTEVVVRAQGHGPVVALVHGWQGHSGQFSTLRRQLLDTGFTVLTFDMPAHGESSGRTTSIRAFVDTILSVGTQLGPLHSIVAHSLGATATALALARGLEVQSTVLISPMISFDFALDEFSKVLGLGPASRELAAVGTEKRVGYRREEVDLLRLDPPKCPVKLIHDRNDLRTPVGYSYELATKWPHAQFSITEGLGHRRILEDKAVLEQVADFLRVTPWAREPVLENTFKVMPSLQF